MLSAMTQAIQTEAAPRGQSRPIGMDCPTRKFLVVADGSAESDVAIRFAAGRAAHVGGGRLVLFHAIPPTDFEHWMAVADRMREEALEEAEALLGDMADRLKADWGIEPEIVVREGQPKEALRKYVEECPGLFALILGASAQGEPGPLVEYFSGPLAGSLSCPVVIVPGALTPDQIDAMV